MLVAFIDIHSFRFHHAFGFFNEGIAEFAGVEQKKTDAVFAVVDGFAFIVDCTEFFWDVDFKTDHSGKSCHTNLSDYGRLDF